MSYSIFSKIEWSIAEIFEGALNAFLKKGPKVKYYMLLPLSDLKKVLKPIVLFFFE